MRSTHRAKNSSRDSCRSPDSADSPPPFSDVILVDSISKTASLLPSLSLSGFKVEIVFSHLVHKLVLEHIDATTDAHDANGTHVLQDAGSLWVSYIHQVLSLGRRSTSYLSALAVAVCFFARCHKDVAMQEHGARIYSQALNCLLDDMKSPTPIDSCSSASAPLCLSLYEMVRASNQHGWAQHSNGVAALVSRPAISVNTDMN